MKSRDENPENERVCRKDDCRNGDDEKRGRQDGELNATISS